MEICKDNPTFRQMRAFWYCENDQHNSLTGYPHLHAGNIEGTTTEADYCLRNFNNSAASVNYNKSVTLEGTKEDGTFDEVSKLAKQMKRCGYKKGAT
jgi:hypothetical protein